MRPNPCNASQGDVAQYAASLARNTGANPYFFLISALGSFTWVYTTHGTNGFTSHSKGEAMVKCLAFEDTSVTAGVSNPHSANQKHQSLNSVVFTVWPRHFPSLVHI